MASKGRTTEIFAKIMASKGRETEIFVKIMASKGREIPNAVEKIPAVIACQKIPGT